MSNAIEAFLYRNAGVQSVIQFDITQSVVRIALAPFEGPRAAVRDGDTGGDTVREGDIPIPADGLRALGNDISQ